jgi:hypothetical protein
MKQPLTGFARVKAIIARWIIVNIAFRISPLACTSLCLEVANLYNSNIETNEEVNEQ